MDFAMALTPNRIKNRAPINRSPAENPYCSEVSKPSRVLRNPGDTRA